MRLKHHLENKLSDRKMLLSSWSQRISESNPAHKISQQIEKVKYLQSQFEKSITHILEKSKSDISRLQHILQTVSPVSTLDRGYAIVTDTKTNSIVTNTRNLHIGDKIRITLSKADIDTTIDGINEK